MTLRLHHFFILTEKPKETGNLLVSMGLKESFSRDHKGQGTSNRRFEFSNGMLELLYVRDRNEAENGPAGHLRFVDRVTSASASPFGLIFNQTNGTGLGYPFSGWTYQPDYLEPPNAFHIGDNSEILEEPLCFYAPFFGTPGDCQGTQEFSTIKNVKVSVPRNVLSETLLSLKAVGGLQIETGDDHVLRLTLDGAGDRQSMDFRPDLPLIIIW